MEDCFTALKMIKSNYKNSEQNPLQTERETFARFPALGRILCLLVCFVVVVVVVFLHFC